MAPRDLLLRDVLLDIGVHDLLLLCRGQAVPPPQAILPSRHALQLRLGPLGFLPQAVRIASSQREREPSAGATLHLCCWFGLRLSAVGVSLFLELRSDSRAQPCPSFQLLVWKRICLPGWLGLPLQELSRVEDGFRRVAFTLLQAVDLLEALQDVFCERPSLKALFQIVLY